MSSAPIAEMFDGQSGVAYAASKDQQISKLLKEVARLDLQRRHAKQDAEAFEKKLNEISDLKDKGSAIARKMAWDAIMWQSEMRHARTRSALTKAYW